MLIIHMRELADGNNPLIHPTAMISGEARFYGNPQNLRIGPHCRIDDGCILTGDVTLEGYNHLAPYCVLYGKAGLKIGRYSGFGVGTCMHTESDDYHGDSMVGPMVPDWCRPTVKRAPIFIGQNVLGGTRVTILPGVMIGDGAALGAHALISENCQPWTIYAGAPAHAIGARSQNLLSIVREFEASLGPE